MSIQRRIGLAYLSGALPCFEDFGNLPTDLVPEKGLINGKPASEVLDMLILPSGSLLESQSVSPAVSGEILKMSAAGKFVLGIGSGLQVLAKQTIRDSSTDSIMRKGLGLINATIQPLICTDQVKAHIIDKSFLGNDVDVELSGFHCHTYGKTILHSDSKPVLVSHIEHANYRKAPQNLVSGIANKEGNIVGLLVHALLDQNPAIIAGITKSLDIDPLELQEIRKANAKLTLEIKNEIGINTSIQPAKLAVKKAPVMVLITALGSGSGKTFLVTGMAGALRKRGYNVGLIKVGGDVRDSVPALYLVKAPMKR
ncbi:MAG: cobyrinic acid a,c-diamide synthase, partial [Candidatus Bathyarchaeota archaeon]|nr:cobyrinic acid a,c-diamide synthase [Candidatus Termiticorpusculum sp.]